MLGLSFRDLLEFIDVDHCNVGDRRSSEIPQNLSLGACVETFVGTV